MNFRNPLYTYNKNYTMFLQGKVFSLLSPDAIRGIQLKKPPLVADRGITRGGS